MTNLKYRLIFTRNKYGIYYTNIYFNSYEDEMRFFQSYVSSHVFNKTKKSLDLMIQEGWFADISQAKFVLNLLNSNENIVVIPDKDIFLVVKKEYYEDFYLNNKSVEDIKMEKTRGDIIF